MKKYLDCKFFSFDKSLNWGIVGSRVGMLSGKNERDQALTKLVQRINSQLTAGELDSVRLKVRRLLGPVWDQVLDKQEQDYLRCGRRCMKQAERGDADMARSAGLSFGLAVEYSLLRRLYEPLKSGVQQADYHPTLGRMVGKLNKALSHVDDRPGDLQEMIVGYLRSLPNPASLFPTESAIGEKRRERLEFINRLRIDCAHPGSPPESAELQALWEAVVAEPDTFFRYFGAAYLRGKPAW